MNPNFLVIDRRTMTVVRVDSADKADRIAASDALGAHAIEWAVEQYGRCDGNDFTIIPEEWTEP